MDVGSKNLSRVALMPEIYCMIIFTRETILQGLIYHKLLLMIKMCAFKTCINTAKSPQLIVQIMRYTSKLVKKKIWLCLTCSL